MDYNRTKICRLTKSKSIRLRKRKSHITRNKTNSSERSLLVWTVSKKYKIQSSRLKMFRESMYFGSNIRDGNSNIFLLHHILSEELFTIQNDLETSNMS